MNGLEIAIQMTRDFADKVGVSPQTKLVQKGKHYQSKLNDMHHALHSLSQHLTVWLDDPRLNRLHLIVEETAELADALMRADEVKALDALADLLYVVLSTASTFDLPLAAAFAEVHRSNMTKERQPDDPEGARCRQKGPNYSPPNLKGVLEEHRNAKL